jgi:hypothetical protein
MVSAVATTDAMTAAEKSGNVLVLNAATTQVMSTDLETADVLAMM